MTDSITAALPYIIGGVTGHAVGSLFNNDKQETDREEHDRLAAESQANAPKLPEAPTKAEAPGGTQADASVQRARDEERRRAGARQGRGNTILTGSLGVQGPAPTARKSLLGE
jgi:hypothetical protein